MATGSSSYNTRTPSRTRQSSQMNGSTTISRLTQAIQHGSMNVTSTHSTQRPLPSLRQPSVERRNIPTSVSTTQRRISTDSTRSRLSSQDRSNVATNGTYERRESNATNDESLIDQQNNNLTSSIALRLRHGGVTGLQNLGNTCFMNSVLQCLSNTRLLLEFCFRDDLPNRLNRSSTSVMKGALMKEYANLMEKMWSSSGHSVVSPSAFKNIVGRFAPRFLGYSQQDSQEFLRYLLQGLHEDVNQIQQKPVPPKIDEKAEEKREEPERAELSWQRCLLYDKSAILAIFAGQLKSTLECSHCQYQSTTFDVFWDLSIPLPRNKSSCTVQECIQLFMSKEELDGNEKPMCARCKQKRRCTKKFSIQKCPEILVLHLKRFSQARTRAKLNAHVDFPITNLRLDDLTDVMSESYPISGPTPTYNLFGISNHSGTAYSGHYVAQCKHPYTQQWYEFNDSSVYSLNEKSRIVSSNAYVLFYERIQERKN